MIKLKRLFGLSALLLCSSFYFSNLTHANANNGPAPVNNLRVDVYSANAAEILWDRSVEGSFVVGYEITIDEMVVNTLDALSYFRDNWILGQRHVIAVVAIDNAGLRSAPAGVSFIAGKQNPPADPVPDTPPNLKVDVYSDTTAEIVWDRSQGPVFVIAYELVINDKYLGEFDALSYYAEDWVPGKLYSVEVTAVGNDGSHSEPATVEFVSGQRNFDQITLDNYASILTPALRMVLTDYLSDAFETLRPFTKPGFNFFYDYGSVDEFDETLLCEQGGVTDVSGVNGGSGGILNFDFQDCQIDGSLADGVYKHKFALGDREQYDGYDLQLINVNTSLGQGEIELMLNWEFKGSAGSGNLTTDINKYQESSGPITFSASGTTEYEIFQTNPTIYNAELVLGFDDAAIGSVKRVTAIANDFGIELTDPEDSSSPRIPFQGPVIVRAADGSSVTLSPSVSPSLVDIVVQNSSGETAPFTVAWQELEP